MALTKIKSLDDRINEKLKARTEKKAVKMEAKKEKKTGRLAKKVAKKAAKEDKKNLKKRNVQHQLTSTEEKDAEHEAQGFKKIEPIKAKVKKKVSGIGSAGITRKVESVG